MAASSPDVNLLFEPLLATAIYMPMIAYELRGRLLGTILSTAFFGTLVLCTCIAVVLISRKLRKTRWAIWYTIAAIAMFTSTSVYWVLALRNTFIIAGIATYVASGISGSVIWAKACLQIGGSTCNDQAPDYSGPQLHRFIYHDIPLEYCVGTAALTTNITIGDAIVLGRVWVLWPRSRLIRLGSSFLLLATLAMGVVSTAHSCVVGQRIGLATPFAETSGLDSIVGPSAGSLGGSFFEGDPFGMAATVLSLATNVISTCLIMYQAWKHRAFVRGNGLRSFLGRSQVSRAFTLLIESGSFYSAIWTFVVVYQTITRPFYAKINSIAKPHSSAFRAFTTGWEAFTESGLVVVIAIYPTVIMLLVALNGSECDTVASYRDSGQGAAVPSLVFRGSVLQSVNFTQAGNGRSAGGRASSTVSSSADDVDCSYGPGDLPEP